MSVAVTPERLSEKVIVIAKLYVTHSVIPTNVGGILSIQSIVCDTMRGDRRFPLEYHAPVVNGHVPR